MRPRATAAVARPARTTQHQTDAWILDSSVVGLKYLLRLRAPSVVALPHTAVAKYIQLYKLSTDLRFKLAAAPRRAESAACALPSSPWPRPAQCTHSSSSSSSSSSSRTAATVAKHGGRQNGNANGGVRRYQEQHRRQPSHHQHSARAATLSHLSLVRGAAHAVGAEGDGADVGAQRRHRHHGAPRPEPLARDAGLAHHLDATRRRRVNEVQAVVASGGRRSRRISSNKQRATG